VGARAIRRLLIANRGEIAVRIARACRALDIVPIAVASEADRGALHTRVATETVVIGPAAPAASYLDGDHLVRAAIERRCDAIHPGYGFLSQSPRFAEAVEGAGLIFVGPPAEAMRLMGDKIASRKAMSAAGVPVVPGYEGTGDEDAEVFRRVAAGIGYPVLVKAAGGGGGRGMRVALSPEELGQALDSARSEARKAFGDPRLFLEKVVEDARHVEVQVLADRHGRFVHLFERECSIQRRFQKIVEESPSPTLDARLRAEIGATAVAAARACGYVSAGTVEFLIDRDRRFHFLEMNTRIQVEHGITEMVTGVDIVQAQIRIAEGGPLSLRQEDVRPAGHAIECRVNAEDPSRQFAPSSGRVPVVSFPDGPGIRVDTGVESGDVVSPHYDSLIAKIMVHAGDRAAAIAGMEETLSRTAVLGVETNLPYLRAILAHPIFRAGEATTEFSARALGDWKPAADPIPEETAVVAAMAEILGVTSGHGAAPGADGEGPDQDADLYSAWSRADRFRVGGG